MYELGKRVHSQHVLCHNLAAQQMLFSNCFNIRPCRGVDAPPMSSFSGMAMGRIANRWADRDEILHSLWGTSFAQLWAKNDRVTSRSYDVTKGTASD